MSVDRALSVDNTLFMSRRGRSKGVAVLKARLDELGWTQSDLSECIGVAPGVVSHWLSGDRVPSLEMAFRLQDSAVAIPANVWRESSRSKPAA
jgi:transcriptional regulator with XRE-family HTH domain